ncbi:MAG: hypothetical protein JST92_09005, partial [Deltaproteobacteria bacterium]|nr:hypothetical protein [Deltaproteobacteria bacterium]
MDPGRDGSTQLVSPTAPTESRRDALGTLAIGVGSCAALTAVAPLAAALLAPTTAAAPDEEAPFLDAGAES